jgi:dolichol-phosphate mannosyltransferase
MLDIVIPVYNECENIIALIESFKLHVKTPSRILICYDHDTDTTLPVLAGVDFFPHKLMLVKNEGTGVHGAIVTGLYQGGSPFILVMPADDNFNSRRIDAMVSLMQEGNDIVTPCRFMPGGCFVGCSLMKRVLTVTAAWIFRYVAFVPTRDATNGFRMFSQCVLNAVEIESKVGFAFSLEILVKAHRKGFKIAEYPVSWHERKFGKSRFRTLKWVPQYLVWLQYALATTYLGLKVKETDGIEKGIF